MKMVEAATKLTAKPAEQAKAAAPTTWRPFESLRREVDRLFEDFDHNFWPASSRRSSFDTEPFWRRELSWSGAPAVDIVEKDTGYEIKADVPGFDEKDIEVKVADNTLIIKGEKKEEKEEKRKGYHLHERRSGSFERQFGLPGTVDADKIEANFTKGVLTIALPKKPEARKPEKKVEIKAS
jgi:HSP20 family protein